MVGSMLNVGFVTGVKADLAKVVRNADLVSSWSSKDNKQREDRLE